MLSCSAVSNYATPWTAARQAPSVHGISQARILEWADTPSSRGPSPTQGSNPHLLCLGRQIPDQSHQGSLGKRVDVTKSYWKGRASRSETLLYLDKFMWCLNLQGRGPGRKRFMYPSDPEISSLLSPRQGFQEPGTRIRKYPCEQMDYLEYPKCIPGSPIY